MVRPEFEYRILYVKAPSLEEEINKLGKQGFKLEVANNEFLVLARLSDSSLIALQNSVEAQRMAENQRRRVAPKGQRIVQL